MRTPDSQLDHSSLSPARRALLESFVRGGAADIPLVPPPSQPRVEPASHAQRRLWFLEQVQQEQVPYTLHSVQHLTWEVAPALLERSVNEIVRRHEVLRTTFVMVDGEPCQQIARTLHIPLELVDLRAIPEADRQTEATRRIASVIGRRMDLERGPLLRTTLLQLGEQQWLFLLAVHHIVFDGPSFPIFFAELKTIYEAFASGRDQGLPPRSVQYAGFAQKQRAALPPERITHEVEFWRQELANLGMLELPLDRRRPPVPSFRGALHTFAVSPEVTLQLQRLAASQNATLFMLLLAGVAATLSRVCGQEDFAIGLPVTGRDDRGLSDAIGFFVDTMLVRCRVDDDPTVSELIARVRSAMSRSLAHRQLPFEMLVEHLRPARDLGVNPFFQVGFQLVEHPQDTSRASALEVARTGAMFDLGLDVWLQSESLTGRIEFNTDLFDASTVAGIAAAFQEALRSMLDPQRRVSELTIWPAGSAAGHAVLRGEAVATDHGSVVDLIAEAAAANPDATALDGSTILTYGDLVARVKQLAGALANRSVTAGSYVALALPRSTELVSLQLASWQCGAAFVPVDPSWPTRRIAQVLADAQPVLTVTPELAAELWQDRTEGVTVSAHRTGRDVAYAIFTSGSTGMPKGVALEHAGLLNVALAQQRLLSVGPGRRVAQLASPTFDASIFEMVLALASGATLVIAPPEALAGEELAAFLRELRVDTTVIPPSLLATMRPSDCPQLQLVCVAGESCSVDLAEQWQTGRTFWNLYGPTETTIWATYGRGVAGIRVPIGHPIPNMVTQVVDQGGHPVAIGIAGELCIGGVGLARGYLDRPELTAERFVNDPARPQERIYRTGDLVRQLRDGGLVFLGRVDRQIKVRGFRIEPDEVEAVLRMHPLVNDAVVDARPHGDDNALLVAYLQCAEEPASIDECRRLVSEHLPQYMVPNHFVALRDFPRSASGKVDRSALPPPRIDSSSEYVEPSTQTQRRVAELMARAAGVARVGAADDFFLIGGHSLAAAELVSRVRAVFKVDLLIRDVFASSTVSGLASRIDQLIEDRGLTDEEPEVPLVRLQRRHEIDGVPERVPDLTP